MELTKTKYKQTEVGLIPEDWEVSPLGELMNLKNGYSFKSSFFAKKGPIVITPGNFKLEGGLKFNDKNTIHYSGEVTKNMLFRKGDLLIVMTDLTPSCDLLGKPGIVHLDKQILHNQRIGKITITTSSLNKEYLYFFFTSDIFSNWMKSTATGSTVRHTSVGSIRKTQILLPPLPEQKAIAEVLSDVDSLLQALEQKLAKKRAIKQGTMQKLLTPPSRASEQGKEDWEVKKLGEIATMSSGGTPSSKVAEYYDGNIIWVSISDITKAGKYISESARMITEKGLLNSSARIFPKNIVLLAMYASIGKCCITTEEVTTSQAILGIEVNHELLNEYLYYYLLDSKDKLANQGQQGTQSNLNKGMVENIDIPLPSIEEQTQIATILSDMDKEIELIEQQLAKYQTLKQGLMQELLTGKIRLV